MSLTRGKKTVDDSAPVSTGTFNDLKSSIDTKFDELRNLILNPPSKTDAPPQPPPADPNSKSQNDGNLEDGEEEKEDDKSNATPKTKPSKGNGSKNFSAMPGPTYAALHFLHLIMPMLETLPCLMHPALLIGNL